MANNVYDVAFPFRTFVDFFLQLSKALTTPKVVLGVIKSAIEVQPQSLQTAAHNIYVLIPQISRKTLRNNWKSEEKSIR